MAGLARVASSSSSSELTQQRARLILRLVRLSLSVCGIPAHQICFFNIAEQTYESGQACCP
eukprot:2178255-Prorocentrum_lima.AAC.1